MERPAVKLVLEFPWDFVGGFGGGETFFNAQKHLEEDFECLLDR